MEYSTTTTTETQTKQESATDCHELRNIKYKTMLLNGAPMKETKSVHDLSNLEKFLENGKTETTSHEPWCKLNKTAKTKKLLEFVETYKIAHELSAEESIHMSAFLRECIDRKRLQRVKDVVYDKEKGIIKEIPALCYAKATKHFTLKNIDKRVSTLKSLAPKKHTAKKVHTMDSDSEEDDEK